MSVWLIHFSLQSSYMYDKGTTGYTNVQAGKEDELDRDFYLNQ